MTDRNSDNTTPDGHRDDSLLGSLKSAGQKVGNVMSDFADRFRDDRADKAATEQEPPVRESLKVAVDAVRERLSSARRAGDIKEAVADFAVQTEKLAKDLYGSASTAVSGTRSSEAYAEARESVDDAVSAVRASVNDAVSKVRGRAAGVDKQRTETDDVKEDAARSLDNLMNRLRGSGDFPGTASERQSARSDSEGRDEPDIIDGEVVSEDE